MNVLVTGATGLLGNNVVRQLLAAGHRVRVLMRESSRPEPLADLEIDRTIGDVRDAVAVAKAVVGCDAVVHCAAVVQIGHSRRDESFAVNVEGTRNVLTATRPDAKSLIYVSTVDTLSDATSLGSPVNEQSPRIRKPSCSYVDSKIAAEELVKEASTSQPITIVHPGFLLGPWDWTPSSGRLLIEVAQHQPLMAPPGGLSVCHVTPVASAIVRLLLSPRSGDHFILAGHNVTLMTFWNLIADLTGRRGPKWPMGPLFRLMVGATGDVLSRFRADEASFNSAAVRLVRRKHFYDSSKAIADLDYTLPPLEQCVADSWNWLGEHGYHNQPAIRYDASLQTSEEYSSNRS